MTEFLLPNPKNWANLNVNSINIDTGGIISGGDITVENSNPSVNIRNNTNNASRATLSLQGTLALAPTPLEIQQDNFGNAIIENFAVNQHIELINHGAGFVEIFGSSYPAGPYLLQLNSSNQIVRQQAAGAVTQTGAIGTTVTFNGPNVNITTVVLTIISGSSAGFLFDNNNITTSSVIQATCNYQGAGYILCNTSLQMNGSVFITLNNPSAFSLNLAAVIAVSVFN
jgi:hypothetical protein